ncbi:acyltransferase [Aquabacterium sp.]|uniref:acyltransferase family protein n=1 Tax=Aquabacterium sp. TaxID=1872578 RepID=UPI0019C32992|nr:acyltransferase [Aquabacterium sp.]MBC7702105.1 acyltransferase [Aquabacterium sp.]
MSPGLSSFLNLSRWLAALLVVIYHVRHLILVDFKDVADKTLFSKALYFAAGLGHEAVMVFFVISGFLVGGLTLNRWKACGPDLRAYAFARVSRIYTVLIPALLMGFVLDSVGLHWLNASELYTNSAQYHTNSLTSQITAAMDLRTFLGNLVMMQGIMTGHFGSNGPLWSLANEWWYYCMFALLGTALTWGRWQERAWSALGALVLAALLPGELMLWGSIWALGMVAHAWIKSGRWIPAPWLGSGIFVVALVASRLSRNGDFEAGESIWIDFVRDLILGLAYMVALVSASRIKASLPLASLHDWLAEFSYTSYLCHFPAMVFVVALGYQVFHLPFLVQPTVLGLAYLFGSCAVIYAYCFVVYQLTEKHTAKVRQQLDKLWGKSPAPILKASDTRA